jgi:hypothetical protein
MKMKIIIGIILITNIITLKWVIKHNFNLFFKSKNYDNPNGIDPTNNQKNFEDDLLADEIPDLTNFMQIKETSKSGNRNFDSKKGEKYILLLIIPKR